MIRKQKGFTLAELLIVVAIIAVMVSLAIPQFTLSLERARETTEISNIRSAFSEIVCEYILNDNVCTKTVEVQQKIDGWQTEPAPVVDFMGGEGSVPVPNKTAGAYTVTIEVDLETGIMKPSIT